MECKFGIIQKNALYLTTKSKEIQYLLLQNPWILAIILRRFAVLKIIESLEVPMNLILSGLTAQNMADLVMGGVGSVVSIAFLITMLFFGAYSLYGVYRLKKEQYLIPHRFMYPNYCNPDDCSDPVEYMDYILPRLAGLGGTMTLSGLVVLLTYFIPGIRTVMVSVLMYTVPFAVYLWYNGCLKRSAKKYWK